MSTVKEENIVGTGEIAGLGVGPKGEPGASSSTMLRRKQFAGQTVFVVPREYFHKCRMGKRKYAKYEHYVGNDELGEEIRQYGRNPKTCHEAIILEDELTGAMIYLKYPKGK